MKIYKKSLIPPKVARKIICLKTVKRVIYPVEALTIHTMKVYQIKASHQANLQLNLSVKNKQNSSKFKWRSV